MLKAKLEGQKINPFEFLVNIGYIKKVFGA